MKRYESKYAKCPFYKSEDHQKIYCEGVGYGTSIHIAFGDDGKKRIYKKKFCCNSFDDCLVSKMLNEKYNEENFDENNVR